MLMNTGSTATASSHGLLTTVAWECGAAPEFALEGSVFMAGAITQWLRDGLGIIASAAEIEALAGSVPDSGGVVMVPAFAGLGAPWWDPLGARDPARHDPGHDAGAHRPRGARCHRPAKRRPGGRDVCRLGYRA